MSKETISELEETLRTQVYHTQKWPHYELLLKDMRKLSTERGLVLALERRLGKAPRFDKYFQEFQSYECEDIARHTTFHIERTSTVNLIIIHNLLHHTRDIDGLFDFCFRALKPSGRLYVFDALLRELHQEPHHWYMFTPYGLEDTLHKHGFVTEKIKTTGNPFEAAYYCLDQALQYIPEQNIWTGSEDMEIFAWKVRCAMQHLERAPKGLDKNFQRPNSSFPTAMSILVSKP